MTYALNLDSNLALLPTFHLEKHLTPIKEQRQRDEAKIVFSTNGAETTEHLHAKKIGSRHRPSTLHKKLT